MTLWQPHNSKKLTKRALSAIVSTLAICTTALFLNACTTIRSTESYRVSMTVSNDVLNSVDSRLFGHMLEKASFGEPGPELVVNQSTGALPADIMEMMRHMNIPVIRFPGGTDADYTDWRDTINNAPERPRFRKIVKKVGDTTFHLRFGVDEFCRLKREMGFEAIMVVNLLDGLARKRPVREAAETAAGLIAYCNAPEGAKLPKSLSSWPSIRAKNGNPTTLPVEYVQLGNELWQEDFAAAVKASVPHLSKSELSQWYIDCISVYIGRIRAADHSVKIILDGDMGGDIANAVFANKYILKNVDYLSWHKKAPGPMSLSNPDGSSTPAVTADAAWNTWVSALGSHDSSGDNIALGKTIQLAKDLAKPVACTDWNWSGWPTVEQSRDYGVGWQLPAALSCASWLNGLIRDGDTVRIGIQSVLMGGNWDTTSIRVDPAGKQKPFYMPQGRATALYSRHHGSQRLSTNTNGAPTFLSGTQPQPIKLMDVVATASENSVFIHAVNKSRTKSASMDIRLAGFKLTPTYKTHTLTGSTVPQPNDRLLATAITEESAELPLKSQSRLKCTIPAASVQIIELTRLKQ